MLLDVTPSQGCVSHVGVACVANAKLKNIRSELMYSNVLACVHQQPQARLFVLSIFTCTMNSGTSFH